VTNTGNVTLSNVVIDDALTGSVALAVSPSTLAPGATGTATATYTVTQADMDAGEIVNVATATGTAPDETTVNDEDTVTIDVTEAASIDLVKTADKSSVSAAGEVVTYTFTVTNTGNVTLTNVVIDDALTGSVDLAVTPSTLAPGATGTATATYTVTQADMDAGEIVNVATAMGTAPDQTTVSDEDTVTVGVTELPSIDLLKIADREEVLLAGDEIVYTLTVTNTGNVTLTGVTVSDPLTGLDHAVGTLGVGESVAIPTSYVVTQDDVDAGEIVNVAAAAGTSPAGTEVSDEAEEVVTAIQNPDIEIDITDNDANITEDGEEITYTITVTNTGNVTLTDVTIVDTETGLVINVGELKPGESKSVDTTYPVDQDDVDSGSVTNEASVTGDSPNQGDDNPTDVDEVTTPINPMPSVVITKAADKAEIKAIGEQVVYTLTVTNTGNVTLTDVTVTDPLTGLEENLGTLAPDEVRTIETVYTVTREDLLSGSLVNVAAVTATAPDESQVGDQDDVTVGVGPNEIIANDDDFGTYFVSYGGRLGNILDNDLLDGQRPDPADVDFEFTELDGVIGLLIDESGELSLIPGVNEQREYRLEYTLREVRFPDNSDDAVVIFRLLNDDVNLSITKEALQDEVFEGDEFDYEIVLSNIGGTDAYSVVVTDELPNGVSYVSSTVVSNGSNADVSMTVTGNRVTWTIPFFAADASITFRVRVKAGAAGTVTNTVVVGADAEDTDESDNQASDVTVIQPFHIPNVITPNNDGDNDSFEIQGLGKFVSNSITIFNRYGDHVLEQDDYRNDWTANGQVAGTYFYVLTAVDSTGREHTFKGWIQVIKD
ncbi:gliding motility-associated C-terminal domain-containing protein, partial [Algoriphagus sp. CAU 1675]|uniref:DUF7507 domain-containing protein n=1 Tax=Algoriphagus sp. CAU 1675 TaxID=3032597 RepID=UPI0023D99BC4